MARVILDIPKSKLQTLLDVLVPMGINTRIVTGEHSRKTFSGEKSLSASLKKISSSFILFDWEFFSNQLEYE